MSTVLRTDKTYNRFVFIPENRLDFILTIIDGIKMACHFRFNHPGITEAVEMRLNCILK